MGLKVCKTFRVIIIEPKAPLDVGWLLRKINQAFNTALQLFSSSSAG
jgi:hypothetical protein